MQTVEAQNVEHDVLRVVEEIRRRYDGRVIVQYLDPRRFPGLADAPYRIVERRPDGQEDIIFEVWTLDDRVLAKLEMIDGWKQQKFIDRALGKENKAARLKAKQEAERRGERKEFLKRAVQSDRAFKFYNRRGELVTYTPDKPIARERRGYFS